MPFVNAWRKAKVYFAVQSAFTLLFAKPSFCASTPRAGLQYMDQGRCRLQSLRQAGVHFTLPLCQCMVPSRSAFASQSAFTLLFPKPFFFASRPKAAFQILDQGPCRTLFTRQWAHVASPFCQRVALKSAFYERYYRRLGFCLTLCNAKCLHFASFLNVLFLRVDAKSCISVFGPGAFPTHF